jgi:neutral ceramidase
MISNAYQQVTRRCFLGVCGGLVLQPYFGYGVAEQNTFRAGAAIRDITPEPGVSLVGHMTDRKATHVHDPLNVRCLVLDDGATRLAFVTVDSCMVPRQIFEDAKARIQESCGIPVQNMLMAATHSHSAPSVVSLFQTDPVPGYDVTIVAAIVDGVCEAHKNLAPAEIAWGAGVVPDEVFCRRWLMKPGSIPANPFGETTDEVRMNPPRASEDLIEPAGPTDPEVPFIALRHKDGRPLAVLANYALHYVGGTDAGAMSADYFGCFATALTQLLTADAGDAPFLAMLSNGASGNINNINFRETGNAASPYEQMNAVANKVAQEVYRVYQTLSFNDWVPLAATAGELMLGVRRPNEADITRAQSIVDAVQSREMKTMEEIYARETLLLQDYPAEVSVPLQVLRIGDAAITAIPCEVFVETGLHLKATSPFSQTIPIELANGYNGYLPTAEQYALGGYETWRARSSCLEVHAADKIEAKLRDMLEVLRA